MKVLMVIDMLKDFIERDGALFCGEDSGEIIPVIKNKVEAAHKRGDLVIYLCDSHKVDDLEFKMFNKHCLEGTRGSEIIEELLPQEGDLIVKKTRFSGFYGTNLSQILEGSKPEEIEVMGVCTSICVMDTVGGFRNRDYRVVVDERAVADFDSQAHSFALKRMANVYGVKVIKK